MLQPPPQTQLAPADRRAALARVAAVRRLVRPGWAAALGLAAALSTAWAGPADVERGRRLFNGELPLPGRVTGHTTDLPPQASRCINCHAPGTAPPQAIGKGSASGAALTPASAPTTAPVNPAASRRASALGAPGAASTPAASFGPGLTADSLTRDIPRRGGPPSHYDEAALCKLLLTGIDPAYIIIPRSMPRYDVAAADCSALWAYLSQRHP